MEKLLSDRILSVSSNIDIDLPLYRYMSIAQFLSLIENEKLFLKKVRLWDDTWEAPDDQLPIVRPDGSEIFTESLIVSSTVGQCWTYENDSDAMWRIYSPDCQGVMIETSVGSFHEIKNLRRAVLGKVLYFNKDNYIEKRYEIANNKSYCYAGDMVLKREAFKHENEVRFLVCLQGYLELENCWDVPVVGFDIDIFSFIKSIKFDPRADDWFVNTMKKYCLSKGLKCLVEKSDLYQRDFYKKTRFVRKYEVIDGSEER